MSQRQADRRAVAVCGAGAAGLAAALAAARNGARVVLLEAADRLGGTVTHALIHTLAGLYDSDGHFINAGLPRELAERLLAADSRTRVRKLGRAWVLSVCPRVYERTVTEWLAEERDIAVCTGARVVQVVRAGPQVKELAYVAGGAARRLAPAAVIDATGTAEVVRLLDEALVSDEGPRAAGGWIVRLASVAEGALDFPKGLAVVRALREAASRHELPRECSHAWIDLGIEPDEAFLKLFVPLDQTWRNRREDISRTAHATALAVIDFLRQHPDFAKAHLVQSGNLGIRDGGRIRGRYELSAHDVRSGSTFADAVCRCAWPIEYWDPERGVSVEYLPVGRFYEIPMRALQLDGIENLWAIGKCLSADGLAHASARVVGTCWAMGQAAGAAAAAMSAIWECHDEPVPAFL
jgi:ribulose 1,5-bisphosphate synthetase/thiazole synthase